MADPDGDIWKKLAIDDRNINKRVWLLIHQTMSLSGGEKKKLFRRNWGLHLCEMGV